MPHETVQDAAAPGFAVHNGDIRLPLAPGVTAVPFGF